MKTDKGEQTYESKALRERATEVRPEKSRTKKQSSGKQITANTHTSY